MKRRAFIAGLGGAAAWPFVARGQQAAMPVAGYLNVLSPEPRRLAAFLKGLQEAGYIDGHNVAIQYRWAENHSDRLPAMVAELVHSHVTVIAATTTPAALAARAATSTIPIVFETGLRPAVARTERERHRTRGEKELTASEIHGEALAGGAKVSFVRRNSESVPRLRATLLRFYIRPMALVSKVLDKSALIYWFMPLS